MSQLQQDVITARAKERDARLTAERLERESAKATAEWLRTVKIRRRAELWARAEELRTELGQVEAEAASIKLEGES